MTLIIRPFACEDIESIVSIELLSFNDPWTRAMFASELRSLGYNFGRVAEDENHGEVVGYCFFWVIAEDEVQISNIAVHPNRRRQGIAQLLVNEAIREGRTQDVTSISLEVRESNHAARAFYARMGFEEVGKRPRYYQNPREDGLILRMKI